MKKSTRYLWSLRPKVNFSKFKKPVRILVLLLFCGLTVNAYPLSTDSSADFQQQKIVVSGKVTDPTTGDPMIGVNIMVKGTTIGTISDASGKFALPAAIDPNSTLIFTFIGYAPKEVPVQGKSYIDVTMASDITGLKEVVITALGISREKKSLAYSVSDVKTEDLVKAANNNLMKSLDGKISGVNLVSLSSDPTSSVLVNIRGTSLMPSSGDANVSVKSQPLYVIDGIPVGNQGVTSKNGVDFGNILSQLNPEDIENITILKGGSAGALYGSEGGNGVVMITTKSGKGGKKGIGVSFSTSATMDQPYQFIEEQSLFGQGERAFEWQYDNTDTWGPALDGSYTGDFWNTVTQKWDNGKMVSANENRLKAYLRNGSTITTNINISGNYDKGSFRLSFTDMGNKGVMPNTATNQKSFTLNSEYKMTDKIKISANAAYVRTYSPNKANVDGSNSIINRLLFNFPANLQPLADMKNYWMTGFEGIIQNGAIMKDNGIDKSEENPWWSTYEKINHFTRDNFFGKLQLDWQLSKDFAIMLRSGMDNIRESYEYRQSFGNASISSRATGGDGQFQVSNNNNLNINSDAIITFNKNIGKWDFSAAAGANYTYSNSNGSDITASALTTPGLFTLGNVFPSKLVLNMMPLWYLWIWLGNWQVFKRLRNC